MLPDIAGQERRLALGQGSDCVRRRDDLQLALVGDEESPAAAELADRGCLELLLELLEAAAIAGYRRGEFAGGAPPPCGFIEFQKKVWFHTWAALLNKPAFVASL